MCDYATAVNDEGTDENDAQMIDGMTVAGPDTLEERRDQTLFCVVGPVVHLCIVFICDIAVNGRYVVAGFSGSPAPSEQTW